MAMKEIKSFSVQPSKEGDTIKLWQAFGWELVGAPQEIYNKDSNLERRGDDIYSVTTTTHYIKLTFERDPARPNYEELKSLEAEYEALKDPYDPYYDKPKIFFGTLATIISSVLWFVILANFFDKFPFVGMFVALGFPAVLIFRLVTYPKKRKAWKKECEEYSNELNVVNAKREEIISKAQSLV